MQYDAPGRKHGWMKFGQRLIDVTSALTPNEIKVYLQLGVLSRKPYAGDPSRNIPPTPPDEVGMVRAERGRRLTNTRLSEMCGVPRRHIGDVLDSLVERGLIERTDGGHLRVSDLPYLTGESDEPDEQLDENEMEADSAPRRGRQVAPKGGKRVAPKRGKQVAPKRGSSGRFLPQKEAAVAPKGGGRWTPDVVVDSKSVDSPNIIDATSGDMDMGGEVKIKNINDAPRESPPDPTIPPSDDVPPESPPDRSVPSQAVPEDPPPDLDEEVISTMVEVLVTRGYPSRWGRMDAGGARRIAINMVSHGFGVHDLRVILSDPGRDDWGPGMWVAQLSRSRDHIGRLLRRSSDLPPGIGSRWMPRGDE